MQKHKILSIVLLSIVILMSFINFGNIAYASTDPVDNPNYYNPGQDNRDESKLKDKAGVILGVVNTVGVVVSVLTLMAVGIKYMIGSVEEKAEYKKTAITYFLGATLVFGVTTIPNILYKIAQSF